MAKRNRLIIGVDQQTWSKFAGYSKLENKTQAQFLSLLIEVYEEKKKNSTTSNLTKKPNK